MTALDGSTDPGVEGQVVDQLAGELAALDARELELQAEIAAVREAGKRMRAALRALDPEHERAHPPGQQAKRGPAKPPTSVVRPRALGEVWAYIRDELDGSSPFVGTQVMEHFASNGMANETARRALYELRDAGVIRLAGKARKPGQVTGIPARAYKVVDVATGDRLVAEREAAAS